MSKTTRILFVCTGNTCRSPIAEAVARDTLSRAGVAHVSVDSAGLGARDGDATSPEALAALGKLGIRAAPGASKRIHAHMLERADRVFGLTASHVESLRARFPAFQERIALLDPDGRDVPDPIGGPQSLYDQTALTIAAGVQRRLKELHL